MPKKFFVSEESDAQHSHCHRNKSEIGRSANCGCFYCTQIFKVTEITDWTGDKSALCPYCNIDSVIGDASKLPITKEFLSKMQKEWF